MKPQKWLLFFGIMSFGLILFLIGWDAYYLQQERLRTFEHGLNSEIQSFILEVEKKSDHALAVAEFLRMVQKDGFWGQRKATHNLCQRVLDAFPHLSSVFVLYEPNADEKDKEFIHMQDAPIYVGPDGQFASLWIRDIENQGRTKPATYWASGLYDELKHAQAALLQQNRPVALITEPKHDEFMNMGAYFLVPIMAEGVMRGVCGVQLHLDTFYKDFKKFGRYAGSHIFLLSQEKRIILSTLPKQFNSVHINDLYLDTTGQPLKDIYRSVEGKKTIDLRKESSFPKSNESRSLSLLLKRYFAKSTLKQKQSSIDTLNPNNPLLVVSAPVATTNWHIVSYVPEEIAKGKLMEGALKRSILALCLLALSFGLVAIAIGRANVQEREFLIHLEAIRAGDLDPNHFDAEQYTGDHAPIVEETRNLVTWLSEFVEALRDINLSIASKISQAALRFERCGMAHKSMLASLDKHEITLNERSEVSQDLMNSLNTFLKQGESVHTELETSGRDLSTLEQKLSQLADSSDLFSSRLNLINEKAQDIYKVVNLIGAITDKTNLLSFNASIEAEKATEHAAGFIAVSGKLRRLSEQTTRASQEIDERVKELHTSVFSGVVELDKFAQTVQETMVSISKTSRQIELIFSKLEQFIKNCMQLAKDIERQAHGFNDVAQQLRALGRESAHYVNLNEENFTCSKAIQAQAEELMQMLLSLRTLRNRAIHPAEETL